MKKKVFSLLLAVCLTAAVCACSAQPRQADVAELLSLGEQYLTELDYEQALVQFLKVIEIEPRNVQAYLGAAEAYEALGQIEDAIAILEQGLIETGDEEITTKLQAFMEDDTKEDESEQEQEEEYQDISLSQEQAAVLRPLEAALLAYDMEAAFPILANEAFWALCRQINESYRWDEYGEWMLSAFDGESLAGEAFQNYQIALVVDWERGPVYLAEIHLLNGEIDGGSMMTYDREDGEMSEPYNVINVSAVGEVIVDVVVDAPADVVVEPPVDVVVEPPVDVVVEPPVYVVVDAPVDVVDDEYIDSEYMDDEYIDGEYIDDEYIDDEYAEEDTGNYVAAS